MSTVAGKNYLKKDSQRKEIQAGREGTVAGATGEPSGLAAFVHTEKALICPVYRWAR